MSSPTNISLYFHVPFCTRKCHYCHFYVLPDKDPFKEQWLQALRLEWDQWLPQLKGKKVISIYFGGGTPALIGPAAITKILSWIRQDIPFAVKDPEITLEANPENISLDLMKGFAESGINRVSIGLQTLDDHLLKSLSRLHSADKAIESVHLTAQAGISNISVDLMYDLPGQTFPLWESTLKIAAQLPIKHLSLYNLTIEPHTVFFKYRNELLKLIPDEKTSLEMYEAAVNILSDSGFIQYEISAFSKENQFSRHNVGYWTGRPFLGLGPSAFSYWEGKRFRNIANLSRYKKDLEAGKSPIDFEEKLAENASIRELFVIQLRLISGVDLAVFEKSHGKLDKETLETIDLLKNKGYLQNSNSQVCLTKRGVLFYDTVASELI